MKIKFVTRIRDLGDGSKAVDLFPSMEKAREGVDHDDFGVGEEIPYEFEEHEIDTEDYQ